MSEEYNATQKPVMRSEISRYAYGGFGVNIVSSLFASFAVYFMTDVAGLNVAVAGIGMIIFELEQVFLHLEEFFVPANSDGKEAQA